MFYIGTDSETKVLEHFTNQYTNKENLRNDSKVAKPDTSINLTQVSTKLAFIDCLNQVNATKLSNRSGYPVVWQRGTSQGF